MNRVEMIVYSFSTIAFHEYMIIGRPLISINVADSSPNTWHTSNIWHEANNFFIYGLSFTEDVYQ